METVYAKGIWGDRRSEIYDRASTGYIELRRRLGLSNGLGGQKALWWPDLRTNQTTTILAIMVLLKTTKNSSTPPPGPASKTGPAPKMSCQPCHSSLHCS